MVAVERKPADLHKHTQINLVAIDGHNHLSAFRTKHKGGLNKFNDAGVLDLN